MTSTPATEWLHEQFEQVLQRHAGDFRYAPGHRKWRGPEAIRPMIELLPEADAATSMRVTTGDYGDPDRWWL